MPQLSTRTSSSPGPMCGVGTCWTATVLSPVYTAACMTVGTATTSEASVGNEISQGLGGAFTSSVELKQCRHQGWSADGSRHDLSMAESSGAIAHLVEIQWKILSGCVGNHADGVKRNVPLGGFGGDT